MAENKGVLEDMNAEAGELARTYLVATELILRLYSTLFFRCIRLQRGQWTLFQASRSTRTGSKLHCTNQHWWGDPAPCTSSAQLDHKDTDPCTE